LAWHTMKAALEREDQPDKLRKISTEEIV